jgi:hypothetical protein
LGIAALSIASEGTAEQFATPHRFGSLVSGANFGVAPTSNADILWPRPDAVPPIFSSMAGLASRLVLAEGGPSPNSASSAAGYGQFLRGTWLEVFGRTYPRLARQLTEEQILALREVRPLALELTGHYAQQNASSLRRLGLPATEGSLSLAHFVGAAGAINVLGSHPDAPIETVLGHDVVTANPFIREMSAGGLRRWAAERIGAPAAPLRRPAARSRFEPEPEPLKPSEDFLIDGRTKASQALTGNRDAIAKLQSLLDADAKIGTGGAAQFGPATAAWLDSAGIDPNALLRADPAALKTFEKSAARLVIETVRSLAKRPTYGELKPLGGNTVQRTVARDIAFALIAKMRRENETIFAIQRHRRTGVRFGRDGAVLSESIKDGF